MLKLLLPPVSPQPLVFDRKTAEDWSQKEREREREREAESVS